MVICRVTEFARVLQSRGKEEEIEMAVFLSCVPGLKACPLLCIRCRLIRFSVSRVWFSIHPSYFSLPQILHLPRTSFAAVIRPLFNQFLGGHRVKGNDCPIRQGADYRAMPNIRRD